MANIRQESHPSRVLGEKSPPEGRYSGRYLREGSDTLKRISDGLTLVIGHRKGAIGIRSSPLYLVDKSKPNGYLSNLYGQEFDDKIYRYQISVDPNPETYVIEVIRTLKKGLKRRGKTADV